MTIKRSLLAAGVLAALSGPAYAGSEIETLINMLHENGMVNDDQYGRLMAELKQNQAQAKQEKQQVDAKLAEATKPSDVEVTVKGGIGVKTRDGKFESKLGGRLQADAASYSGQPEMGDGSEFRRARISYSGTMYNVWDFKLEYDFASTGSNGRGITDAYLAYTGFEPMDITVGNFKTPFSLDYLTSANNTLFMERALPNAFSSGRKMGIMASNETTHWSWATGIFGDSITNKGGQNDEGWGVTARGTWAPINDGVHFVHLGLGLNYRDTGDSGKVGFDSEAESHVSGVSIIDTGDITSVADYYNIGAELAAGHGPYSVQGEYITTKVNRNNGKDADFDGWYLQAGYILTGETRQYKNGVMGGVKPSSIVGEGGYGAWELALRYSSLDLSDAGIDGGEADAMTYGVNWYPTPTLRFSANYVDVLEVDGGPNDNDEPSVFQVRSQWAF